MSSLYRCQITGSCGVLAFLVYLNGVTPMSWAFFFSKDAKRPKKKSLGLKSVFYENLTSLVTHLCRSCSLFLS